MWIEASLSRDDLWTFATELCPLDVLLGGRGDLRLSSPRELSLVPDRGFRFECDASLVWPALGMGQPIALSLGALICPEIETRPSGDALTFAVAIDHVTSSASFSALELERIEQSLNHEFASDSCADRSWDFSSELRSRLRLSEGLEPLLALDLDVCWGKVRVTAEAMVLAISFRPAVVRYSEGIPFRGPSLGRPLGSHTWATSAIDDARAITGRSAPVGSTPLEPTHALTRG